MDGSNAPSLLAPLEDAGQPNPLETMSAMCQQLRTLFARSNATLERERLLMARRLHDDFAQKLTAASIELCLLDDVLAEADPGKCSPEVLRERVKSVTGLLKLLIKSTCKLTVELRPKILEELGIAATIQWQVHEFEAQTGIGCQFHSEPDEIRLDLHRSTEIYRIAQELLLNVARHANASDMRVSLRYDSDILLQVQDNGCGISEEDSSSPESLGLAGIRERVHLLGGEFRIHGIPGDGTLVVVSLPAPENAARHRIVRQVC
jgi:two-component system, NarL family, sensor histidine kinase UhpB